MNQKLFIFFTLTALFSCSNATSTQKSLQEKQPHQTPVDSFNALDTWADEYLEAYLEANKNTLTSV